MAEEERLPSFRRRPGADISHEPLSAAASTMHFYDATQQSEASPPAPPFPRLNGPIQLPVPNALSGLLNYFIHLYCISRAKHRSHNPHLLCRDCLPVYPCQPIRLNSLLTRS